MKKKNLLKILSEPSEQMYKIWSRPDWSSDKPLDKIWIRLNFDLESAVIIVLAIQ